MKNLALLLLLLKFSFCFTQSKPPSSALSIGDAKIQGFSTEKLKNIDAMFKENIKNDNIPGAVAMIVRNGKIVFSQAYGMADNPGNKSMKTDNIFRIASMSKAITATGVMMLWEQGKIMLDDPISRYIPEFKNPVVLDTFNAKDSSYTTKPAKSEITIRQLLTHSSGIGYGVIDADERMKAIYKKAGIVDLFTTEPVKIGNNIKKMAKLPLHFTPGERFLYSEGLDVCGYLIEVVSGKTFDVFLKENLFDPLQMTDTYFYLPQNKIDRLVKVQTNKNGKWEHFSDNFYDTEYPAKGAKQFLSGGAGLSSTAKDYATFLQMYLNNGELGGKRILSRTTVNSILKGQVFMQFGEEKGLDKYGLAFAINGPEAETTAGKGSEGTFTWGGYFNTDYFADPKEKIIGILMKQTQQIKEDRTSVLFKQMIYSSLED